MKPNMKSLKRTLLAASLVIGQVFAISPAVLAADSNVRIAGSVVLNEIATAGGLSGSERAVKIQQNLDNALVAAKDAGDQSVGVSYVNGMPVLTLGGYHVATVDSATAKQSGVTPALLAERWASALRSALADRASVDAYIAHLTGESTQPTVASAPQATPANSFNSPASYQQPQFNHNVPANTNNAYNPVPSYQGRVVYAPAGLVIPATLSTAISTDVARPGDVIQASVSQAIILGDSQIPVGSKLLGQIAESQSARFLGRTGTINITFTRLRTPDGQEAPISASLIGEIDKYDADAGNTLKGQTWKGKALKAGVQGTIGAGTGAALGTAIGAIAGGGRGAGHGAWSGTAIGAGVGLAHSLLSKGKNVVIQSGTPIQLKLDSPLQLAGSPSTALNAPIAYNGVNQ